MKMAATYARISVTERCNLRCFYCMGGDSEEQSDRDRRDLSFDALVHFAAPALACGVRKFRLTGGEPLLHPRIIDMVAALSGELGVPELGLTTNGVLFGELARDLRRAGLRSVNMSLPSLRADTYRRVTGWNILDRVLLGMEQALAYGFRPVKLNVVLIRGVNDGDAEDLAALAREYPVQVRFIEYMPFAHGCATEAAGIPGSARPLHVPGDELLERLRGLGRLAPTGAGPPASAARVYSVEDWPGTLGFITPISRPFCEGCSRIRLTARGRLRACLVEGGEIDISDELAQGLSRVRLGEALERLMDMKPACHRGSFRGVMNCIGG